MFTHAEMPNFNSLLSDLEDMVSSILGNGLGAEWTYHDLSHTLSVRDHALFLGEQEGISEREMHLLEAAALLHDIGILEGLKEHELTGAQYAQKVLPHFGFEPEEVAQIRSMILATRMPQRPSNTLARILCDADLFYLGTDHYPVLSSRLREEWSYVGNWYSEKSWASFQVQFLSTHNYHTIYGRNKLEPVKARHLKKLQKIAR